MYFSKLTTVTDGIITFVDGCPSCGSTDSQGGVTAEISDEVANEENSNQETDVKS